MNVIYERILELCKERGTTYNSVCKELGLFPSVVGNLKSNENKVLKLKRESKLIPEARPNGRAFSLQKIN